MRRIWSPSSPPTGLGCWESLDALNGRIFQGRHDELRGVGCSQGRSIRGPGLPGRTSHRRLFADEDVPGPSGRSAAREVELWYADFIILEVAGALFKLQSSPFVPILHRLPGEVVVRCCGGRPRCRHLENPPGRLDEKTSSGHRGRTPGPFVKARIDSRSQIHAGPH